MFSIWCCGDDIGNDLTRQSSGVRPLPGENFPFIFFLVALFLLVLFFFTIIILPVGWIQFIHILHPLITASQGVAINIFLVNKERVSLPKLQCNGDGIKKAISVKFGSHYHWPIIRFTDIFWDE